MLVNQPLDLLARRTWLHSVETFTGKGKEQELACRELVDSAGAQIEERVLFNLADGRSMRTLYVVGIDLQLRLGVDLCVVREQQVAIRLLGVGLLRIFVNDDAAVKHAMRVAVEDAVIKLAAATVWAGMLYQHVIVQVLLAIPDKEAID